MELNYIFDEPFDDPRMNMAIDEMFFNKMIASQKDVIFVRFYEWKKPCCSFGYSQRINEKQELKNKYGKNLVRRPTGGGFVFHDKDTILTFISRIDLHPQFKTIASSYNFLHTIILKHLQKIKKDVYLFKEENKICGNYACFFKPVRSDIMFDKQKIVGSAQKRLKAIFVQQSSILMEDFQANDVLKEFEKTFKLKAQKYVYDGYDWEIIDKLFKEKYSNDAWNFQK